MAPKWKLHKEGARQYEGKLNPARGIADKRPFEVESASELRAAAAIPHGILRALAEPLALSPFSLDALCASLTAQERTNLLDEAMVSLLFVLFFEARHLNGRRDPNPRNPAGSPPGRGTSEPSHRILSLLDHVTWPKFAVEYLRSRSIGDHQGLVPALKWMGSRRLEAHLLPPSDRLAIMQFLCDDALETSRGKAALERRAHADSGSNSRGDPSQTQGARVEVAMVEYGFRSSYYRAFVTGVNYQNRRTKVRFEGLFMREDTSKRLELWIELDPPVEFGSVTPKQGGLQRKKARPTKKGKADEGDDDDIESNEQGQGDQLEDGSGKGKIEEEDAEDEDNENEDEDADWKANQDGDIGQQGLKKRRRWTPKRPKAKQVKSRAIQRIRPTPPLEPLTERRKQTREAGSHVEVWGKNGWWLALVTRSRNEEVDAYLPGEDMTVTAHKEDVRTALYFEDDVWRVWDTGEEAQLYGEDRWPKLRHNVDYCVLCHSWEGDMLLCDSCSSAFHEQCCVDNVPEEEDADWYCPSCQLLPEAAKGDPKKARQLVPALRSHFLGFDSNGTGFWLHDGIVHFSHGEEAQKKKMRRLGARSDELFYSLDPSDKVERELRERLAEFGTLDGAADVDHPKCKSLDLREMAAEESLNPGEQATIEMKAYENKYKNVRCEEMERNLRKAKGHAPPWTYHTELDTHRLCGMHCQLGRVAMRILDLEQRLLPLMEPWWVRRSNRRAFAEKVYSAVHPLHLGHCLIDLEAGARRIAFVQTWHNDVESSRFPPFADVNWDTRLGRHNSVSPAPRSTGGCRLPEKPTRPLARQFQSTHKGFRSPPDGITFHSERSGLAGWSRRKVGRMWRAECERAATTAAVAIQMRHLEGHIRWSEMEAPPPEYSPEQCLLAERRLSPEEAGTFEYRPQGAKDFVKEGNLTLFGITHFERAHLPENATHWGECEASIRAVGAESLSDENLEGKLVRLWGGDVCGKAVWSAPHRFASSQVGSKGEDKSKHEGNGDGSHECLVVWAVDGKVWRLLPSELYEAANGNKLELIEPDMRVKEEGIDEEEEDMREEEVEAGWMQEMSHLDVCALIKEHTSKDMSKSNVSKRRLMRSIPTSVLKKLDAGQRDVRRGSTESLLAVREQQGTDQAQKQQAKEENVVGEEEEHDGTGEDAMGNGVRTRRRNRQKTDFVQRAAGLGKEHQANGLELLKALRQAQSSDGEELAKYFEELPAKEELPEYWEWVQFPADFVSIESALKRSDGGYTSVPELLCAFELCFTNAQNYNEEDSPIHAAAGELRRVFQEKARQLFPGNSVPKEFDPVRDPSWQSQAQLAADVTAAGEEEAPGGDDDDEFVAQEEDDEEEEEEEEEGGDEEAEYEDHDEYGSETGAPPSRSRRRGMAEEGKTNKPRIHHANVPPPQSSGAGLESATGQRVLVNRQGDDKWWLGVVKAVDSTQLVVSVQYANGSVEPIPLLQLPTSLVQERVSGQVTQNMRIAFLSQSGGVWLSARLHAADPNSGRCLVYYDAGGENWVDLRQCAWQVIDTQWWIRLLPKQMRDALAQQMYRMQQQQLQVSAQGGQTSALSPTECLEVLNHLRNVRTGDDSRRMAQAFEKGVGQSDLHAYSIDLQSVEHKLRTGQYSGSEHFKVDLEHVFAHAIQSHPESAQVHQDAQTMLRVLADLLRRFGAPPSSGSQGVGPSSSQT